VHRLAKQALFSLAALATGPMWGCGGQVWAGFIGMGPQDSQEARCGGLPSTNCFAFSSDTLTIASIEEEEPSGPTIEANRLEFPPGPGSVRQHDLLVLFDSVFFSLLRSRLPHGPIAVAGECHVSQPFCRDEPPHVARFHSGGLFCCPLPIHLPAPPIQDLFQPPRGW
jgi:hypothetical protein